MGDVENLKQDYPQELAAWLQDIYDYKDCWLMTSKLEEGDDGITDDTHKVVETTDQESGDVKERYQYEFVEDPNWYAFRLGFTTSDEVKEMIAKLN
jgi:hypothetical protein